ncbi:glycosyltransferase [Flavobacteriaceae bacterium W22]|uniref:glycosyltransferase family 2 protein n=1 Tax=Chryseobacterium binzhouense TaxID=2593646 RepID=UPI001370DC94|nr:glycosyltransferase family 2 protein [Chryseobacterium binzhouense]MXS72229.1 glycosyltransferase [Flavobacteriaceae bacterium W22]
MNFNISVIIPVYNAAEFLENAVNSALQFEEVKEILLIEDKSTDHSLLVCQKLSDNNDKIKLFQHADKGNHGAGATRNLGLEKASHDFIAFLDADDYYLPNRFDAERELFNDKKIEGVFGAIGVDFLSKKGKQEFERKFRNNTLTTVNYHAEGNDVFLGLLRLSPKQFGVFFSLIGLTIRKSALERSGLRFNEELRVHQDTDFNLKLSYLCHLKTGIIDKPVSIRGVHDDNRITKIKPYSAQFYNNIFKLYTSLYFWSKSVPEMNKKAIKVIRLRHLSFKIANMKGIKKYLYFAYSALTSPVFAKTEYRFHALKKLK